MKLTSVSLENWLCHRRAELAIAPLTVLCGPNGRGKSAVRDAIAFALLAELRRITAKGDRGQLISEGFDRGSVSLRFGDVHIARDIGSGKLTKADKPTEASSDGLPYVLDPPLFAGLSVDDRRVALLRIMGVPIDTAAVHKELVARGRQVKLLGSTFAHGQPIEKWHETACTALTTARGAWKGITGEAYGCKKAETWAAAEPEQASPLEYQQAQDEAEAARNAIQQHQHTLGMIDHAAGGSPAAAARRFELERQHGLLPERMRHATEVATEVAATMAENGAAEAHLMDVAQRQPGRPPDICPHCGCEVMRQDGVLEPYVAPDDPATPEQLEAAKARYTAAQEALRGARARELAAKRAVGMSTDAGAELAAYRAERGAKGPSATLPPREEVEAALQASRDQLAAAEARISAYARTQDAIATAQATTKRAAEAHAKVAAWQLIVDDLAPSGIPQTLLGSALEPLNVKLRDLSALFRWPQPRVGQDMTITLDGRLYGLRSESEKWRADTLLAIAIASITGLRIVVLDRMDVLELSARAPTLATLYSLTRPGSPQGSMLDTCIVAATMKAAPQAPPDVKVIWLGDAPALQVAA